MYMNSKHMVTGAHNLTIFVATDMIDKIIEMVIEPTNKWSVQRKLPTDDGRDLTNL